MNEDDLGPIVSQPAPQQAQQVAAANGEDALGPIVGQVSQPQPDLSAMKKFVKTNVDAHNASQTDNPNAPQKNEAQGFFDSLMAGIQGSTLGLAFHGMPTTVPNEHASAAMRMAGGIGAFAGDFPAMVAGGIIGDVAGGGLNPVTAGTGAFAAPAMLRKMLMDHYEKGDITNPSDFVDRLMSTAWETIKGGTVGAATAYTGGLAGAAGGTLAKLGTELATMTTTAAALEGRFPTTQEFEDGALLIGGLHAVVGHIIPKMRNIYAETGATPAEQVDAFHKDIIAKQDVIAGNDQEPPEAAPKELTQTTPAEPKEGEEKELPQNQVIPKEPPISEPPKIDDNLSDEEKDVLSHVVEQPEAEPKTFGQKFDDWYAKTVDYLDPINSALKVAAKGGADMVNNAYQMARRFAAHMDTLRYFLEYGTRDAETGEINGEGLNQILRDADDVEENGLNKFRAYGIAKRAIELDDREPNQNGEKIQPYKGFDREKCEAIVAAGKDKYEDLNQRRIAFENRVLDFAQGKGLISDDSREAIDSMNKQHIPLNKVQDPDMFTGGKGSGAALKRIFGADRDMLDPILQTYKNTEMILKKSLINDVRNSFINSMRDGGLLEEGKTEEPLANPFLREVQLSNVPTKISSEEVTSEMRKQGIIGEEDDPADAFNIFRPEKMFLADNQIQVMVDGERKIYEGSPGLIDSLKRMDGDFTSVDTFSKIMKGFAKVTRLGVVLNPGFAFTHFFRSQIMASIYSETGLLPFVHSASVIGELLGKSSQDYQDWLYHGGAAGTFTKIDADYVNKDVMQTDEKDAPVYARAWNAVKTAADAVEGFIKLTDNASRFAEYKRSVASGSTPEEAAFRSREVVPDYQKVGLERSALRTGVAFIGAHITSLDRMAQAFQEDPIGTSAKMSAITAVSAMLWAANKDDDAIQALPDWQKNTYWNINVTRLTGGGSEPNTPATILRLPKPWAPGVLFGSGIEVALDHFTKENPRSTEHFVSQLFGTVIPPVIPNIAQPVMDQFENRQSFTGRPLINEYQEKELPEMQYAPYTSETAKGIAKLIGYVPGLRNVGPKTEGGNSNVSLASPIVVENYIRCWGGTLGGWALKLADQGINTVQKAAVAGSSMTPEEKSQKLAELNVDKASPWEDTPLLHSFVSRYPSFNNQNIQDFYENKDEADRIMNSLKAAQKSGDYDASQRIMQEHPDMMYRLDDISKGISTARKTYGMVQDNADIPAVEKRQLLDTMLFQINEMAKQGNKMVSDFKNRNNVQ